eukprot:c11900_g1_i2.p1 GENE.c11900_g1_i2~~c11900_g1_i2.p1  ORF type:complete len:171 (+),score=46.46 c11900_g1_i2:424-936(+)
MYPGTDVVIILYDSSDPSSLNEIEKIWIPELLLHVPTIPWLLTSTGVHDPRDMRSNNASAIANKIGIHNFPKTSDSIESVRALFEAAFHLVILPPEASTKTQLTQRQAELQKLLDVETSSAHADDGEKTAAKNISNIQEAQKKLNRKLQEQQSLSNNSENMFTKFLRIEP